MNKKTVKKLNFPKLAKGTLIGVVVMTFIMLAMSILINYFEVLPSGSNAYILIAKAIAIFVAILFAYDKSQPGYLVGLIVGILISIISFVIFSYISGNFVFDKALGLDIIYNGIIGFVVGVLIANFKG